MPRFVLYLCLSVFIRGSAFAAPPTLTYLYPAGSQRGTTVEVAAAGTFDPWPVKVWVGGKGVSVEAAKDKGKFAVTVAKDAVPGVYWLRAFNDDGASALRPFIVGTLPDVTEKEPNDEFKKPQAIGGNAVVNGKLEKVGDVDCFAVGLKNGQTLVASLEAHRTLRSPMDAILQVASADGFVLDENHDYHGLDPQLAFTAHKDGTYVVRVFAFPASPDSSIRFFGSDACVYRLTLTTGPFADFARPVQEPDVPPQADIHGWNVPKAGMRVAVPTIASGETHAVLFAPELANTVRMRIEPHAQHVRLERVDRITPRYEVPFSFTTRLFAKGTAERVTLSLKKGQALSLHVESRSLGLPVNAVIEVSDKDEKRLARAEPTKLNSDTTLSFNPPADGQYYVAVSDLYGGGGTPRDVFLLRVLSQEPDYDLTVAADRFTVVPGKPTTIPVKVNRRNGFAKPVEIVAEGLPEGVKLAVKEPAKPDPNTVTVELTADKPFAGPFRLVGKVKDEPKLTRTARASLPEFEETTAEMWLTATSSPAAPPKK